MAQSEASKLDHVRLLASLTDADRRRLEQHCRWRRYQPGEQILDRDDASRDVLFVAEGKVRIVNYASSGREVAYAVVEAGGHVGELSAIDGKTRSASVVAGSGCLIAQLPQAVFHQLLEQHASVAVYLLRHLARMVRIGDERIAELSTIGAVPRVYRELLRLARPDPGNGEGLLIKPLPTQQDMASQVGATRETVARALGQLAAAGVIERRGRTLVIPDRRALEQMAHPEGIDVLD